MKRWVDADIDAFKKASKFIAPATILKIPKSDAPNAFRISLVVIKEATIEIASLAYRYPVFLTIRPNVDMFLDCLLFAFYFIKD